jgi:DNA-binding response OmpR family regulator
MRPLSIIVADDVSEIQEIVAQWLKARGHRVVCASTGYETLKLLRNENFDLVILDVLMPDGDGLDVITELQKMGRTERVLAISGGGKYMPAADCVKLASGLGSHAALLKPFDERQLMAGIERALRTEDPAAA